MRHDLQIKESESNSCGDGVLEDVVVMVEVERGGGGGIGTSNWSRADRRVNPCIHPPLHYLQLELSLLLLYIFTTSCKILNRPVFIRHTFFLLHIQ